MEADCGSEDRDALMRVCGTREHCAIIGVYVLFGQRLYVCMFLRRLMYYVD